MSPPTVSTRGVVRIPMSDGVELAGDLQVPVGDGPWPVLVMHIPYRANDFLAASFEYHNQYFVAAGYAVLVVDFRGLGASGGVASEAFSDQEGRDSADVIAWAAAQSWSSGAVGMWGVSYGGITALRAAAERPAALRAIVAIQGTADRYGTVYPGGALNFQGAVGAWGSLMLALQLLPPSAQDEHGAWREEWERRLPATTPYVLPWLAHPTLDEFWRPKQTVVEAIEVPTFLIGGWRDIFADDVVRDYEALACTKKLWMGPWMHGSPDFAPAHAVDHLPAMRAWWDRWLRGESNGIDDDPPVTLFVQNETWRQEHTWPIHRTETATFAMAADGSLVAGGPSGATSWIRYEGDATVGVASGLWEPLALGGGGPREQTPDDLRSLCFTTAPVASGCELTGRPRVRMRLLVPGGGDAIVVARLCEVLPSGASLHVTSGHLRLTCREGFDRVAAIAPGQPLDVAIELDSTAYQIRDGSRLRVAVSTSLFPQLRLDGPVPAIDVAVGGAGGSSVEVPIVMAMREEPPTVRFPPIPASQPETRRPLVRTATPLLSTFEDLVTGTVSVSSGMRLCFETADRRGVVDVDHVATCGAAPDGPSPASLTGRTDIRMTVNGSETVVRTSLLVADSEMTLNGVVLVDGRLHFEREWRASDEGANDAAGAEVGTVAGA